MNVQTRVKVGCVRQLAGLVASRRILRLATVNVAAMAAHRRIVRRDRHNRPRQVQEDVQNYFVALLRGLNRAADRGILSAHVAKRMADVFIANVLLRSTEDVDVVGSLGFAPPKFVLVSPTGRCNLRCKGCYAESDPGNHASLDFDTFDRILTEKQELWGSHFTVISGGEPFLWRDGERDLLDMVAKHDSEFFMVYTNGTLIDDETAKRMGELGNISPAISVEGFEEETDARRGRGTHAKVLAAFDNLRRHGVPFGVSATPTRENWEVITSDEFVDFYFDREGAVYCWLFQYMPIGREQSLDLMVEPENRVEMLRRMQRFVREREVFVADFWNSGPTSSGCICAGRRGGYFYIDWNGDIMPCGFVPYSTDNICRIYSEGGDLNTALGSPLFARIREWQDNYGFTRPAEGVDNWLCPCVIRDHFGSLKDAVMQSGARPINEPAAEAMSDPDYCRGMLEYGKSIRCITDPIWEREYVDGHGGRRSERHAGARAVLERFAPVLHRKGNNGVRSH